jgi:pyochelin biosynthesis protein PchC
LGIPKVTERLRWIRCFHPTAASRPKLVCFPHAGGSASYYHPLSRALTPNVEMAAVQYPGRQDRRREPYADSVSTLVSRIVEVLEPPDEGQVYAFFGHSMGAVIAYEVARRLLLTGARGPQLLFVSGRHGPAVAHQNRLHLLGDAGLIAHLGALGGTDPRVLADTELLATILPVARADYKVIELYKHVLDPMLRCPVTALVGDADPWATVEEVASWERHTTGEFDLNVFPGGHFYLDENWHEVAGLITQAVHRLAAAVSQNGVGR